ncbi:alpha/beta hydrolase [Gordonia sinesedis]
MTRGTTGTVRTTDGPHAGDRTVTVVIVPGLRDHVADHWQTHLAERVPNARTVPPLDLDRLSRAAQVAALDAVISDIAGPVVLVAHSAGVQTVVQWATEHGSRGVVLGALLVAPADLELPLPPGYPSEEAIQAGGWRPIPRRTLPFPSVVGVSRTDPLGGFRRVTGMAECWGSRVTDLGDVGHVNPASGYGYWPRAEELLAELVVQVTPSSSDAITTAP